MRIRGRVAFGSSLWLRFARSVAHSVIVVAGKFASILICGLDSSGVTHSHNPFCAVAFLVHGQGFFGLTHATFIFPEIFVALWNFPELFSWSASPVASVRRDPGRRAKGERGIGVFLVVGKETSFFQTYYLLLLEVSFFFAGPFQQN